MSIGLVDTTILLNLLDVPGKADERPTVLAELEASLDEEALLLLPFAAVVETGNHIAQLPDGRHRRACAQRFVNEVRKAYAGQAPWTIAPLPDRDELMLLLDRFVDDATRGLGFTDQTILAEWHR